MTNTTYLWITMLDGHDDQQQGIIMSYSEAKGLTLMLAELVLCIMHIFNKMNCTLC